jgi:hypothetical protein
MLVHRFAGSIEMVVVLGRDIHAVELVNDGLIASGRVGQKANALACRAQAVETVDDTRIWLYSVVDHPPEIEDEAVVTVGHGGHAGQDFYPV